MIEGLNKTKTEQTLKLLEESPFTFHLTGSRAFGTNHPNSDWDFFVQDDEDAHYEEHLPIRAWLSAKGFRLQDEPMYESSNTAYIYKLGEVHVQVVHDAEMKSLAQEILKSSRLLHMDFDRKIVKRLWEVVFHALEIGFELREKIISG